MTERTNILFVDDERQILVSLRALFRFDYNVFLANSGAEALTILREHPIHVVVSDQRMPQMLGHELLREVKKCSPTSMRLLLTGYSDLSAILHSINQGEVFRFINKPWDNDELRKTVASAAQIARNTMSSVSITAAQMASPTAAAQPFCSGVLVIDDSREIGAIITRLYKDLTPVYLAHTLDHALALLGAHEIGIIVADITVSGQDTTEFVKLLKQQYPLIMTVVLTEAVDAELAVELINQGQIFRYLGKPISEAALKLSLNQAFWYYRLHQKSPHLLQRHQVEAPKEARNTSLAERLFGQLKSLRRRFSLT